MLDVEIHVPVKSDFSVSYIKDKYYVYALFKVGDIDPFYVGKGVNNRINQHFMKSSLLKETNRKSKTIRKHFENIRREILCYFDSEDNAFDFEEYLISHYRLVSEGGSLLNIAKSRHEIPETSKKSISEKKTSRQIVYSEEDVVTLYKNYFEERQSLRECVQGTMIPRRYSSAICRGERFKGLYIKYIESGLVKNYRLPEDNFIRKDPQNQKVSDEEILEMFDLVCSGKYTLDEICSSRGFSPTWMGRVFIGLDRNYLNLNHELYKALPKGKHVAMERAYSKFTEHYSQLTTNIEDLVKLVGRSEAAIYRFIRRYRKEMEAEVGSLTT